MVTNIALCGKSFVEMWFYTYVVLYRFLDLLVMLSSISLFFTHAVHKSSGPFSGHDLGTLAASSIKHISIHKFRKIFRTRP